MFEQYPTTNDTLIVEAVAKIIILKLVLPVMAVFDNTKFPYSV